MYQSFRIPPIISVFKGRLLIIKRLIYDDDETYISLFIINSLPLKTEIMGGKSDTIRQTILYAIQNLFLLQY